VVPHRLNTCVGENRKCIHYRGRAALRAPRKVSRIGAGLQPPRGGILLFAREFYSVITVDWPVSSKRLRQRIFLQAIMSSLRTM